MKIDIADRAFMQAIVKSVESLYEHRRNHIEILDYALKNPSNEFVEVLSLSYLSQVDEIMEGKKPWK